MLMAVLLSAFCLQTFLVYSDDTGRKKPALTELAFEGRQIWHKHNCQACHQFYGFGGFLGPDLTNAARRLDRARLDDILANGSGQMPAFGLTQSEISAVEAYLKEMDKTGIGQAKQGGYSGNISPIDFVEILKSMDSELPDEVRKGSQIYYTSTCISCHFPLQDNRFGEYLAPDLSLVFERLKGADIQKILKEGRPEKGMPVPVLNDEQRADVLAFIKWLNTNRNKVSEQASSSSDSLPWFEYK